MHPGGPVSTSASEWERRESVAIDWNRPSTEIRHLCNGPVAQLGERLVCIQEVVGSNPVGSTTSGSTTARAYSSVWLERTPDKREVGGSNPPRPTIESSERKRRAGGGQVELAHAELS